MASFWLSAAKFRYLWWTSMISSSASFTSCSLSQSFNALMTLRIFFIRNLPEHVDKRVTNTGSRIVLECFQHRQDIFRMCSASQLYPMTDLPGYLFVFVLQVFRPMPVQVSDSFLPFFYKTYDAFLTLWWMSKRNLSWNPALNQNQFSRFLQRRPLLLIFQRI